MHAVITPFLQACVLAQLLFVVVLSNPSEIFVDPHGSDSGSGSRATPFKTLNRALQAVEISAGASPTTVNINPGSYQLTKSLMIGLNSSGTAAAPVVWQATDPAHRPTVSGGITITNWKLAQPQWLHMVGSDKINGTLYQANVPAGTKPFYQLFRDDQRLTLARSPMHTYVNTTTSTFEYKTGDFNPDALKSFDDAQAVLYESWTASIHRIRAVNTTTNTVYLTQPWNDRWAGSAAGKRYYFQNFPQLLDQPGEWYYHAAAGLVLYVAHADVNPNAMTFIAPQLDVLVDVVGDAANAHYVNHVTFQNIDFQHSGVEIEACYKGSCDGQSAAFLTTAALRVNGAQFVTFQNITVSHVGNYGAWINEGSQHCSIIHSRFSDLGTGALRMGTPAGGSQPNLGLRNAYTVYSDNVLEDGGHWYQMGCGVLAHRVDHANITHNTIQHFRYTGISVGWNWGYDTVSTGYNTIAFNNISDIGQGMLSDMGCIYTLGPQVGTVVNNNVCSKVYSFNYGGWGLYTDEGSSNIHLTNNIVTDTKCAGFHQHYGLSNVLENNVFANVNTEGCDDGGVRASTHHGTCTHPIHGPEGQCSSFVFERNIVYTESNQYAVLCSTLTTGLRNMTFDSNTYHVQGGDIRFWEKDSFSVWRNDTKQDAHSILADPMFVPGTGYAHVLPQSPAAARGFRNIDTSTVGPRGLVPECAQTPKAGYRQELQ